MKKISSAILFTLLLSATVTCYGQQPNISYNTPQVLIKGNAVSLSPANTGGAVPATIYSAVTTLAGSGSSGSADGTGAAASFNGLLNMAKDAAGNIYAADYNGNVIRMITPAGVVTTLAGSGVAGAANGTGTAASFNKPSGIALDAAGNVYVGDSGNNLIRKITPAGVVTTFAGSTAGAANGTGAAAQFHTPRGLAIDAAGNLYVADFANNLIRKITPGKVVTTFAGSGTAGSTNGTGTAANFSGPLALGIDNAGNLYLADYNNNQIRKITPGAVVITFAGSGAADSANGIGTAASFKNPFAIATDAGGNVYVADRGNNLIRKITPAAVVTTLAGTGAAGSTNGTGVAAALNDPRGLVANENTLYVSDFGGHQLRKINLGGFVIGGALPAGLVFDATTGIISGTPTVASPAANNTITAYNAAGSSTTTINITVNSSLAVPNISYVTPRMLIKGTSVSLSPTNIGGPVPATIYSLVSPLAGSGSSGTTNGTGASARFKGLQNMAKDASGNIYAVDYTGNVIRVITPAGVVTTLAGSGVAGAANGTGTAASFNQPSGIAVDAAGNVYIADTGNNLIRKITPAGVVTTFAGSTAGSANGTGTAAQFKAPKGLAIDAAGNLFVADYSNNLIRKITPGAVVTTFAGNGTAGSHNGTGTTAGFTGPAALAIDNAGILYLVDNDHQICKITPGAEVFGFAGSFLEGFANGANSYASFRTLSAIATDASGNIYVADSGNNLIRKVTSDAVVTTLAGSHYVGSTNAVGAEASLNYPHGLVADGAILYFADFEGHQVRKISLTGFVIGSTLPNGLVFDSTTGIISGTPELTSPATDYTITAYNVYGSNSTTINITVNPPLTAPNISYPTPLIYGVGSPVTSNLTNTGGLIPAITNNEVNTLAGSGLSGSANGTGAAASFNGLLNMAKDATGNVYAADYNGNVIRMITPAGVVTTLAGSGSTGAANGTGTTATFNKPSGIALDAAGNVYVGDSGNNLIRKITPAGVVTTFAGSTAGAANGTGAAAMFNTPRGLAIDASGNLYVADFANNLIRKITPGAVVTTFAGSGTAGSTNGTGTAANFSGPLALGIDNAGNLYLADYNNNQIRKITPGAVVTAFAGSGTPGAINGTGTAASFKNPFAIATDAGGNIYVADRGNNLVRKITQEGVVTTLAGTGAAGSTNGTGTAASLNDPRGLVVDGSTLYVGDFGGHQVRKISLPAYFINPALPAGLLFNNTTGNISGVPTVTSPSANYTVTAYNAVGSSAATINITVNSTLQAPNISYSTPVTYAVGTRVNFVPSNTGGAVPTTIYATAGLLAGGGNFYSEDGIGAAASFTELRGGIVTDAAGNIYASDIYSDNIRRITPDGVVTTFAGSGAHGAANGTGTAATFNIVRGLTRDVAGNLYVADDMNNRIRRITAAGVVATFAGSGSPGLVNSTRAASKFNSPWGVAADASGNLYVADLSNNVVRKITGDVVTTFAGSGAGGSADGTGTAATFRSLYAICTDGAGNVYVGDNGLLRKITPAGVVTTLAGGGGSSRPADGVGAAATFLFLTSIVADASGNIWVADAGLVRKVSPAGMVTTIELTGAAPYATMLTINGVNLYVCEDKKVWKVLLTGYSISPALPPGLTFDKATGVISGTPIIDGPATNYTITGANITGSSTTVVNIAIAPALAAPHISYATPQTFTAGTPVTVTPSNTGGPVPATTYAAVTTLAGSGTAGSANGTGTAASFNSLVNMATDAAGNIYVADYHGNVIRKITPAGVATTLAGSGSAGAVNGIGTAASFNLPSAVALDAAGNIYVCDAGNNLIRKITPAGVVTTFAGSGSAGPVNGTGTAAMFNFPSGVTIDRLGNLYIADEINRLIRKITPGRVVSTFAGSGDYNYTDGTGTAATFTAPSALCIDTLGNLYVSDNDNGRMRKITPAGVVTTLATGFDIADAVATDEIGNVYVAERLSNLIRKINLLGVVTTLAGSGAAASTDGTGTAAAFNDPEGLAVADGILYVSDFAGHQVRKVVLTGYTISPALSEGLTFDGTTGVISGTPTAASAATAYTVIAYNTKGSCTAIVNITVNNMGGMALAATQEVLAQPVSSDGPLVKQGLSPNGDGMNDVLIITNIDKYPDNKLIIKSAGGTTVYQASGYDNTVKVFDGHSTDGRLQQAGTYFYSLEYKVGNELKRKTGFIVLKY